MTTQTRDAGPAYARGWSIALAYTAIALVMTWPLVRHIGSEIASDLGDPVFNSWVLMWTGGQVLAALRVDFNAIHQYWHGNIFYPEPLTIAFSEHLTPQMLQGLPIFAATGNIVLVYNLLFLSTFVLSGLGTYLVVRDLTGRPAAAFVAGLAFAFAPYRFVQMPHLQVMSSQWMPFALYGLRRFFESRRRRPLAGAAAAIVAQNLSCGYYLLFFPPFIAACALYEMVRRLLLGNVRVWSALIVAAVVVAAATWPFVSPYFEVRAQRTDVGVRLAAEVAEFSADTHALATTSERSRLWGARIRALPRPEGEGFAGFTILALAAIAVAMGLWRATGRLEFGRDRLWQRLIAIGLGFVLIVDLVAIVTLFVRGSLPMTTDGLPFRDGGLLFSIGGALTAALLAFVPAVRRAIRPGSDVPLAFFTISAVVAVMLAFGPQIHAGGQPVGAGPYQLLYTFVPGFDGVRVPARYLMLSALFLAILAGLGAAQVLAWRRRAGILLVAIASAGILAESWVVPMDTNVRLAAPRLELTPRRLDQPDRMGPLYEYIRRAPGHLVLIEFPYGDPAYDIQSVFYAGYHRRPLVNGYSGFFPENYVRRATFLSRIPSDRDAATKALWSSGATHAIVHEAAFPDGRGHEVTDWLTSTGATVTATYGTNKLLTLAPRRSQ